MCLSSEESVGDKGLGYFPAFVERIQVKDSKSLSKVPNVGRRTLPKVNFLPPLEEAYFVHSFAVIFKNPTDEFLIQKTDIAGRKYAIAIKKGNRIGLQYHPELSGTEAIPFLSQLIKGEFYG
jgi:imidazoleglycerol phosphate synthase glutamine amidotransferase subunit HisH